MALKAGRVGVNPSQVDMAGNVIGGGGDTYTKLEIDQMLGSKVGIGQLEANNKDFYFAYDATTQKYGYKLDNAGDFHPFEEAGGSPGWNKPADLITTGLTFYRCEYVEGGYYVDGNYLYLDIVVQIKNSGASVYGFPAFDENYAGSSYPQCYSYALLPEEYEYIDRAHDSGFGISSNGSQVTCPGPTDYYKHLWGCMKLAST